MAARRRGGFFDGRHIYIVSGMYNPRDPNESTNPISRFDPQNDTILTMKSTVPFAYGATVAWDGHDAYLFGGKANDADLFTYREEIVRFNPDSDTAVIMSATLPAPRQASRALFTNGTLFVIGGLGTVEFEPLPVPGLLSGGIDFLDEIVAYRPTPGPAQSLDAGLAPNLRSVKLDWTEPASNTYGWPISSYRIYRKTLDEPELLIAEVSGSDRTYLDACQIGKGCTYSLSAVNNSGVGQRSKEVSFLGAG